MDAKAINEVLKKWGKTPFGEPLVRLVWSDDARELRRGEFNEFYGSIYLRTVVGVREVPKYSWILHRWVLERWYPPEKTYDPELPDSNKGSFEPVYVFQDARGNALPLNMRVVDLICSAMFNQPPTRGQIRDALISHLEGKDKEEQAYFEEALEISTSIGSALSLGEAIAYGPHKGGR